MNGLNTDGALTLGASGNFQAVNYGLPEITQADKAALYLREEREKERKRSEKALAAFALGVGKGGAWEKDYQQSREEVSELHYLDSSAANAVPGHRSQMLGFEVARRLGGGDTWGTAQRVIASMPEEKRMEWEAKLGNCKTRAEGEVVLGEAFTALVQGRQAEATAKHTEYLSASAVFDKELSKTLSDAATKDVGLDAKTFQQAVHFQWDAEALSTSLDMARAGMRYVFSKREGSKGAREAAIIERAKELKEEYENGIHLRGSKLKTWDDFLQEATADLSQSFNFDREEVLHLTRLLENKDGSLNQHALSIFLLAATSMAEDEQSADSEFWRNFMTRLGDVVIRTADEAGRWDAKLAEWGFDLSEPTDRSNPAILDMLKIPKPTSLGGSGYSYNPAIVGSLHVPSADKMRVIRSAYNPNVEKLRAALANVEDVRLTSSPKASLLESSISDIGSIVGETAPVLLVSAVSGGSGGALAALGGFAASTAALAPSQINRSVSQKYLENASSPELAGYVEGFWNSAAESVFGLPRRVLPFYANWLDKAALKSRSIPGVARVLGVAQGHTFNRYAIGVIVESGGEFLAEPIIAASGTWLTTEGLQMLGVNLDNVEYNPLAETSELWNDESQRYATVAFCAAMGLFGLPANMRAAREFAENQRMMLKVGLKKGTAARISSAHNSGLITTEEAEEQMRNAFREEVIHGDQNEVLKRLQAEKEITLSEVEAATLAQGNLHKAALKLLGVLGREKRGDKNVLTIVDKVKLGLDQSKWEKDEKGNLIVPEGYETPVEEVEYTDDELIAFMRYGLKEHQINLMKRLRSAALADNAAGKLNAREDSGVNTYALSSELMKSEEGRALMGEAATEAQFTGAMTPRILGKISTAAQAEMTKGTAALARPDSNGYLPASALPALAGASDAWGGRVEFAKSQGERADGTNAFRMNGKNGVSDILFNAGHATLPEIAEETMEHMLYRAAYEAGGIDENQNWNDKGREFLRGVAADLQAVREQVQAMTGVDIMPGLDMSKADDPMHIIEHFSHFAQSDFYRNADRYELSEEAMRNVQFVDSALLSADMLKRADKGWQTFIKSDKGKAWMAQGGTLQGLLRNAGLAVASIYEEAYVTTENALVAAEAAASIRGLSIADVMELEEQVKLEDAERDAAASLSTPEPPEETVEGVELPPDDGSEAAMFSGSEFAIPEGSELAEDESKLGRGLVGGKYAPQGDGSVMGMAKVADIHLSKDVPQFKRKSDTGAAADADGTTHKLSGGYNKAAPPITVWRRKDGRLEVITGRHRLAHAKANGLKEINVRVYDEDAAHDAKWAKLYDVEQNILDRQANVQDVAYFFRNTDMTEAEAYERGLMPKKANGEPMSTGTMGITIARRTCDEVFTRFMNGALTREQAYFIATLDVDEKGQELAAQLFAKGKKMDWVKAYVREAENARAASDAPMQFDLFGADESWAQEAAKVADYVAKARKQAKDKLDILSKAGKLKDKQKAAKELGVTLKTSKDVAKTQQRLILLDAALERMDSALNLGERAAAWDGKSAVSLDELQKEVAKNSRISYSTSRASALRVEPTSKKETVRRMEVFSHGLSKDEFTALNKAEKEALTNKGLDEVYAKAAEVQDEFRSIVEDVGKKLGVKVMMRKELKGRERALAKTISDNVGDAGQLLDVNGGTLIFTERDDFAAAVEEIKKSGLKIARIKNGYLGVDPYGYADIKVNVQMPNGFIGEIILIEDVMNELKFGLGHKIYEAGRALEAELEENKDNPKYRDERQEPVRKMVATLQRWSTALYTREDGETQRLARADAVRAYHELRYLAYSRVASSEGSGHLALEGLGEWMNSEGSSNSSPVDSSSNTWYISPFGEEAQAASWSPRVQNSSSSTSDAFNMADSMVSTDFANVNNKITFSSVRLTAEERGIVDKAKAEGAYMLAPNGKRSNLTPKQWAQVRTKAFKLWFGDWENDKENASKVLDENGEPKVVYHNSGERRTVLSRDFSRKSMDIESVCFAPESDPYGEYGPVEHAVFLRIITPADFKTAYNEHGIVLGKTDYAGVDIREWLQERGYDGVIEEENGAPFEYKVFESTQIKSATDNRGAFDALNSNITFSTTSLSAVFGAIGADIKEESMRRLLNSVEHALYRWKSGFAGRDEKVGYDKLAQEMGKLMATAMGVYRSLPAGYRVRLDPMLRRGAVFARMVEEGRVLSYGQIKPEERAALTKRVEESLRKHYPEFYTDSPEWTLKSKEAWEAAQKEATAAVGREEMVRMYEEIAAEAVGAVRRYLKDEELRKLDRFLEALQPRMDSHSRRFRRSNIGVATHDKVVHLAELMEMTLEEQQERLEQLEAEIKTAEAEGDEAKGLELGEEYGSVLAFGALRARGYEDIRAARASLASLVAQSATTWKRKLEREANKAKAIRLRVIRAIGSPDEMRKKEIVEKERNSFWTKLRNLPAYTMSMTQLFDSMTAIPGLGGWAAESCASVVAGHKALISRQNDLYYGMQKFMAEELGLDTETKRNDFMALLKKNETTSITPQADMVVYDERIPYALATEWAMMTPKDRQIAREAWETTNEGMQPLPEAAVATLREQLAQAKPGANVHVRVEYRSDKVKQKLTLSRDQALDIVLRCEQEGYQYNADIHGYTSEVLQQLRDFCGEKVMKLGYFMRERFNRSGVAQAFEAREGVPFPAEENYWPGNFDLTSKGDKDKNALDSSGAVAGTRYGMTKTRVKHNLTFDLTMGATNSFMAGMAMADNYVCFGGLTQQWRSLLANDAFSRRLREYMGEARFSALKDGLNMLDNQGIMEAYAQRAMSSLISRVQAAHAPSVLAGAVTTMFKQVSAVLHGSAYPGVGAVRLMGQLLADRVGGGRMTYGKMMQEPIFAERRRRANKQAWEEMLTLGADVKWSRLVAWSRCGMNTLERVDTASNCVSMTALYNVLWKQAEQSAKEAGTPLDEAATHEACMRAVELTMEEAAMPLTKSQRSLLQACGGQGVWGNLNMYMSGEVLNKVGLVVSKWHKAGGGWKGFWASVPFLVTMSASQQMLCMVIDLLRGKSPDDEDEWLMWLASNFATGISGAGLLNGAPLLGDFINMATAGYARTDTMADVLGMDFWNYGKRVVKMAADDKEHSVSEWGVGLGNLLRVAPTGLGLLGGGAYSTIQWVSTGTGLLQSANAAYNIVRPGFDYARNRERAERKAKRKHKVDVPKL